MKQYPTQDRCGLQIGDKVRVDHTRMDADGTYPDFHNFYGENVGTIQKFLEDRKAPNNGAPLVEITQKFGQTIRVYIDTRDLIKV